MKHFFKKLLGIVICFGVVLGASTFLTACGHKHDYANNYSHNATHHWKVCTGGDECDQTKDYAPHNFTGEWKTKTPKTCTEAEVEYRVCECGEEEYRDGDPASHNVHSEYSMNETEHWFGCYNCDEQLSKQIHLYGQWKTFKQATCTTAELQYRKCECGQTEIKEVGLPLGHSAKPDYLYDDNHHWNQCQNGGCNELLNKTEHSMVNGACSVCHYGAVVSIGNTYFASIADAIASIEDNSVPTTIVLFDSLSSRAVKVPSNSNIIFDLNGHTYTITQPAVGSTGTTTSGFQLLKNSTITFKNGTITHSTYLTEQQDAMDVQILIQNYANLTLENVTLDARSKSTHPSARGTCLYALSNNYGNILIKGNTNIIADDERTSGSGGVAFDLWYSTSYKAGVNVTFENFTGSVEGKIEYGANSKATEWEDKACLTITGGTFTAEEFIFNNVTNANIVITGGTFNFDVSAYIDSNNYICQEVNGKYVVSQLVQ